MSEDLKIIERTVDGIKFRTVDILDYELFGHSRSHDDSSGDEEDPRTIRAGNNHTVPLYDEYNTEE